MERNTQANNGKELRYSFRKYKLRLVSVTIGAVFWTWIIFKKSRQKKVVSTPATSTHVESADTIRELGKEDSIVGLPTDSLPSYFSDFKNKKALLMSVIWKTLIWKRLQSLILI